MRANLVAAAPAQIQAVVDSLTAQLSRMRAQREEQRVETANVDSASGAVYLQAQQVLVSMGGGSVAKAAEAPPDAIAANASVDAAEIESTAAVVRNVALYRAVDVAWNRTTSLRQAVADLENDHAKLKVTARAPAPLALSAAPTRAHGPWMPSCVHVRAGQR